MTDDLVETQHDWYSNDTATFGDRLADARQAASLSQNELAHRIGVRIGTLEKWENDMSEPRANQLQTISGLLNVSLRWLMTGEGDGLAAPSEPAPLSDDMTQLLNEMRQLQRAMVQQADTLGRLQKRLRRMQETAQ
ncbi:helix-turn-helix domain-containing protein [Palleronia pelagia]|uniref:Helix-turn-helix n=1 Tax=Palleronia pelagia TaxID=387096 RepID=A0A1H8GSI7_9RHOB|nr:helix-turn-helix domain-containing protein [Palleronia pelagia]SEN46936.1 Helix-turn-helix [Palleronia pelagia]